MTISKEQFFKLDLGEFPPGTETVNISLSVCSHFTTEYHFSWYRYSLIARHFLPYRSGLFTLEELADVFSKEFDAHSKQSLLHKLQTCVTKQDIPFLLKCENSNYYKANSDGKIMRALGESFRGKIRIPLHVLKLVRGQYMSYIHLCLGKQIDSKSMKTLENNLGVFRLPTYKE